MVERERLAGWQTMPVPWKGWTHRLVIGGILEVHAGPTSWRIGLLGHDHLLTVGATFPPDIRDSQLAAEDAARAMVRDMAAALGGAVTWPTEAPTRPLDCGDNSCMSPERSRGGMRTNGGCCCHLEDLARAHERRAAWWRRSPNYERSERDRLAVLAATEGEATDA